MKPVLLIFPGKRENKPITPFSIIVLATHLRKNNIPVELLDVRISPYENINFKNYSIIGISSKTGEQLFSAVEVCKHIRKNSSVPIVWGGCHPSFFPEQTCSSELVDFVVIGEGEETLVELINELNGTKQFGKVKGIAYKINGKVFVNPRREFLDMETLAIPAYDLLELENYQDKIKYFSIETSRGCPYRCSFCYANTFHNRRWRCKSVTKVIKEIRQVMGTYHIKKFYLVDDNFFVNQERVMDFCEKILKGGIKIEISTFGRADYFSNYSKKELNLIREAGFRLIGIGAESASQRVLEMLNKGIKPEDIIKSAENCIAAGVLPYYSFVIGIPGEEDKDLEETIRMYFKLKLISPQIEINGFFIFTPYPGTPVYAAAVKNGYKPYKTLEEWASWKFSDISNLPWLNSKKRFKLQVLSKIILFLFVKDRLNSYGPNYKKEKLGSWLNALMWDIGSYFLTFDALFRLKNRFFLLGYEWWVFGYLAHKMYKYS